MLNLRKKLLVSIFTLMLALVAVSTTTYAWFTMGKEVSVTGISMNVQGVDGLYVRVVKINGKAAAELETEKNVTDEDKKVSTFKASLDLSSVLTDVNLSPLTYNVGAKVLEDREGAESVVADGTGEYIHVEFEFYSNAPLYVFFDDLSTTAANSYSFTTPVAINGVGTAPNQVIAPVEANGVVTAARLANSLRVAYEDYAATVTPSTSTEGVKIQYATIGTTSSKHVIPSEYDLDPEVQYGQWGGASVEYYNAFLTENEKISAPAMPYSWAIDGTTTTTKNTSLVQLAGNETDGYYGKVTLTIWLEGWDSDCFNAIIEDQANINISFIGDRNSTRA